MRSDLQSEGGTPSAPGFSWQTNGRVLLFAMIFFPLTIALGFWQLSRADEKRLLLEEYNSLQAARPVAIEDLDPTAEHQYRPVELDGRFDNARNILLDNRTRQGRPGYEVVTLFQPRGTDYLVAVNRGWLAGGLDRTIKPVIPAVTGPVTVTGYLYRSPGKPFTLAPENWGGDWPRVIQNLIPEELSAVLDARVFPWEFRMAADSPGALQTGWTVVNIQPAKHLGYAVQWFAMAVALLLLTIFANSNLALVLRCQPVASDSSHKGED